MSRRCDREGVHDVPRCDLRTKREGEERGNALRASHWGADNLARWVSYKTGDPLPKRVFRALSTVTPFRVTEDHAAVRAHLAEPSPLPGGPS